jgi:hypothetical protein
MLRTAVFAVMFAVTGSMAAMLAAPDCSVTAGASPLAWGFTVWWAVDTGAKMTLYPWRNGTKLRRTLLMFKNLSNLVLLAGMPSALALACPTVFALVAVCTCAWACRLARNECANHRADQM